jgi:hypothetical protein
MLANRALTLTYDGRTAEARDLMAQALRLEPLTPPWYPRFNGVIAFVEGRCEEALAGVGPQSERAWDLMYAMSWNGWSRRALRWRGWPKRAAIPTGHLAYHASPIATRWLEIDSPRASVWR